jgi:hypothetical protein
MGVKRSYVWWIHGEQFADYAVHSIEAVKKIDPFLVDRELIVCTDEENPAWAEKLCPFGSGVKLVTVPSDQPTISARLDAQITVLMDAQKGSQVLFLDADALLKKPFPFGDDDLTLTWRSDINGNAEAARTIPYNGGVVGAKASPAGIEAFIWIRARIRRMSKKNQTWNGDQLALYDLAGAPRPEGKWTSRIRWTLNDSGIPLTVKALPCETYNYSPSEIGEDVSDKVIVHLKGGRKDMIEHYSGAAA